MALFTRPSFKDDMMFDHHPFTHRAPFPFTPVAFSNEPQFKPYSSSDLEVISDNKDAFEVELSVSGFRPEDIKIDLEAAKRQLTVTAKSEEKSDRGTKMRQFSRSFELPAECQLDKIQSAYRRDGILKLIAPKASLETNKRCRLLKESLQRVEEVNNRVVEQKPAPALAPKQIFNNYNSGADRVLDREDVFAVEVNVEGFEPTDLSVDVDEATGILTVAAKHQENNNGGNFVSRHFRRQYQVPKACKLDELRSILSQEGVLRVEAPKAQRPAIDAVPMRKVSVEVKK